MKTINDRCRPYETDGQFDETVDGALLRMALLLVPQAETLDGVCSRQGQERDSDPPQRFDDHDRDPLMDAVAPHGVADEDQRQARHEGNNHPADACLKLRVHRAMAAVETVQEGPQQEKQDKGKQRADRERTGDHENIGEIGIRRKVVNDTFCPFRSEFIFDQF